MKNLTFLMIGLIIPVALGGCNALQQNTNPDGGPKIRVRNPDPDKTPKQISLYDPAPVLFVTLEVTTDSAHVLSAKKTAGAPGLSIVQGRPMLISALDSEGRTVHAVSLDNPLVVRAVGAGEGKPSIATLDKATVTVALAKADAIRSLQIEIRQGPGAGLKKTLAVKPGR